MSIFLAAIGALAVIGVPDPATGQLLDNRCGILIHQQNWEGVDPWVALLHASGQIKCAGTLINEHFVLTAAHCVQQDLKVRLGSFGKAQGLLPEEYDVSFGTRHRKFDRRTLANDIGMVRLAKPVVFKAHIQPICILVSIDDPNRTLFEQRMELAGTGWRNLENRSLDQDLRTVLVHRLGRAVCWAKTGLGLESSQFCGGNPDPNTVEGPGGSVLAGEMEYQQSGRMVQLGIASFNHHDFETTRIYTDVLSFGSWIQNVVRYFTPSQSQNRTSG